MWWCGNASGAGWGGWWVVPLICIAVCILFCRFFRTRTAGGRLCCWGGASDGSFDDVRKEIRELKEEIGKIKKP